MGAYTRTYPETTSLARALNVVGGKWGLVIIDALRDGPVRFVHLQRGPVQGISTESLRSRLNQLVADGVVSRQRFNEVPPRVDYELTHRGEALAVAVDALGAWADTYLPEAGRDAA